MATPKAVAEWLVANFNGRESLLLDRAAAQAMASMGLTDSDIADRLTTGFLRSIVSWLSRRDQESLPFEVSAGPPPRLIGSQRERPQDTSRVRAARALLGRTEEMRGAIYGLGHSLFERICASVLAVSGASQAVALVSQQEGGIDLFGRIPLMMRNPDFPEGLLRTTLTQRDLFFLGQCKCIEPSSSVGRPAIQMFAQQARDCLDMYEGNTRPPPKRVPVSQYRKNETAIKFYFTTGRFSLDAEGQADASDIRLVDGEHLAQLLLYHRVGIELDKRGRGLILASGISEWAVKNSGLLQATEITARALLHQ